MALQLLDVDEVEALRAEDRADRVEGEVREVLVVDRVVLEVLDELRKVRELEGRGPVGREERGDARGEVVDVGHLREHVVPEDEIGVAAFAREPGPELRAEELGDGLHAARDRRLGDVQRRLDPEHRDALREEVLQEISVVRRELDDEAVPPEREPLAHLVDVRARMLDPGVRVGREVRVLGEDLLGRGKLRDLGQPAALADPDVQRIEGLAALELIVGQHRLAEGRLAQVDHRQPQRRRAMTADRGAGNCVPVHGGERLRLGHLLHSLHGTSLVDL